MSRERKSGFIFVVFDCENVYTEIRKGKEKKFMEKGKLFVLQNPRIYSYDNLVADAKLLVSRYPQLCTWEPLTETPDGRYVWLMVIGNSKVERKVFVNAGIHGREYITSQLVMKQAATLLRHWEDKDTYKGYSYEELLEGCAVYVIPMVNPDGISISQMGLDGMQTEQIRKRVQQIAILDHQEFTREYLTLWKANGKGTDLNRNFDALWENYQDPAGHPSSDHYKGTNPGSEPESAALIWLTQKERFDRTISYHSQGSVIYWYFAQDGKLYQICRRFAERIASVTGYALDDRYQDLDPAGYKDWAISRMRIPSLTIEVGRDISPVPWQQMDEIWNRNQYVLEEMILDIQTVKGEDRVDVSED